MSDPYAGTWVAVFRRWTMIFLAILVVLMVGRCAMEMDDSKPEQDSAITTR